MKTIYITLIIILFSSTSIAQSPIINLDGWDGDSTQNAYYKDINNYMNPFVGTWLFTNGNTTFKIVLTKEMMQYTGKFYTDYIAGEYQYIENGTEIANTLSNTDQYEVGINGNSFLKPEDRPICNDCPVNERRVQVSIFDNISNLGGSFTLKLTTVNGLPAIEGFIYGTAPVIIEGNPPTYTEMVIPTGTFTFIKQ